MLSFEGAGIENTQCACIEEFIGDTTLAVGIFGINDVPFQSYMIPDDAGYSLLPSFDFFVSPQIDPAVAPFLAWIEGGFFDLLRIGSLSDNGYQQQEKKAFHGASPLCSMVTNSARQQRIPREAVSQVQPTAGDIPASRRSTEGLPDRWCSPVWCQHWADSSQVRR